MKRLFFVALMLAGFHVYSQQPPAQGGVGLIIGNVLDVETSKAIPSITVTVYRYDNADFTRALVTDKDGAFDFDRLPFGFYKIEFSGVGYSPLALDSIHVREERFDFNLGDIRLSSKATDLSEVVVYAEKPLIENREGKITFNVGESALSAGSNTSELLKNMPLVSNDANGNILLKGKEPKILIDDKPTELSGQQLADLLESLPGSAIEKIEVMTIPPPQYANETGGVINIITKKGKIGLTGRVILSYGTRGDANLATNMSYRNQKFSANLSAGLGANRYLGGSNSFRTNYYEDSTSYLQTESVYENKTLRPNLRLSMDYEISKRKTVNLTTQFSGNIGDNESVTTYGNINDDKLLYRMRKRLNTSATGNIYPSGSFTYTWKGNDPRENFRVIADYNYGNSGNERTFFEQFLSGEAVPTGVDSTQRQQFDDLNQTYGARVNYDKPVNILNSVLHFGSTFYQDNFHNVQLTEFLRKSDSVFVKNDPLSNDFHFLQTIGTVRGGWTLNFKNDWRFTASLQGEYTKIAFNFHNTNSDTANEYWKMLPHMTLRKEWNDRWNISGTYRRSIRRPRINELNPSITNNDPYNLRFGNPGLYPQLADHYDINMGTYRGKVYGNFSVGYNRVKDIIQSIRTLRADGKTDVTFRNITDRQEYEASLWGGYTFSRQLRVNASAGYSYNVYSEYDREVNRYMNGSSFYTGLNYNYILTDRISLDGNFRFSAYADPQGKSRSNLAQNIGVQTKYFNKQLVVSLNLIDIFAQQQYSSFTYGPNFNLQSNNRTNSRNIRISLSYNLKRNRSSLSEKQRKQIIQKVKEKEEKN